MRKNCIRSRQMSPVQPWESMHKLSEIICASKVSAKVFRHVQIPMLLPKCVCLKVVLCCCIDTNLISDSFRAGILYVLSVLYLLVLSLLITCYSVFMVLTKVSGFWFMSSTQVLLFLHHLSSACFDVDSAYCFN